MYIFQILLYIWHKIWLTLLKILRDKLPFAKWILSAFRNVDMNTPRNPLTFFFFLFLTLFLEGSVVFGEIFFLYFVLLFLFFNFYSLEEEDLPTSARWVLSKGRWLGELSGARLAPSWDGSTVQSGAHSCRSEPPVRQLEPSQGRLWFSEHLLSLLASISYPLPARTFHPASLSCPPLERNWASVAGAASCDHSTLKRRRCSCHCPEDVNGWYDFNTGEFHTPSPRFVNTHREETSFSMAKSNKLWMFVCVCGQSRLPAW